MPADLYQRVAVMIMSSAEARKTSLTSHKVEILLRRHFPTEEALRRRFPSIPEDPRRASQQEAGDVGYPALDLSF